MDFSLSSSLFAGEQQFKTFQPEKIYDVIIVGGGPAGMTAAVYALRKGMVTGLITKQIGGQMAETAGIENYLGYRYINGVELTDKFHEQVTQFGIDFENNSTVARIVDGLVKEVHLQDGRIFKTRTLIIASGKVSKKLQVPGEQELTGHGVAYCAICDAPFYKDKTVVVAGGGNAGIGAVLDLARIATHVTVIQRRNRLIADKVLVDKLQHFDNVTVMLEHVVKEIIGEKHVTGVRIEHKITGEQQTLPADGIFVEIGSVPNSTLAEGLVEMNENREIIVDEFCRTKTPGIFAAGDVTDVPYKQIIIACGEAAKAALSATDYIMSNPNF
jgi:alkyl hydroperoxide reductase subunit F